MGWSLAPAHTFSQLHSTHTNFTQLILTKWSLAPAHTFSNVSALFYLLYKVTMENTFQTHTFAKVSAPVHLLHTSSPILFTKKKKSVPQSIYYIQVAPVYLLHTSSPILFTAYK
jgi:hypothetical protein